MRREQSAEHIQAFLESRVGKEVMIRVLARGKVSVHVVGVLDRGVGHGRGRGERDFDWAVSQAFDGHHAVTSVRFDAEHVQMVGFSRIDIVL